MVPLTLSEIWIYPIKSLGGIAVNKANVRGKGLHLDRRWMLIDSNGVAMTQRMYPEMALFKPGIHPDRISVAYKKYDKEVSSIELSRNVNHPNKPLVAKVWNDEVNVVEVDPQISEWFSHHLKTPCKLVSFPEENPRPVDRRYTVGKENVSLADAYPFLIIGQSSLDDLNRKLEQPVPMNRFRPNFVFTDGEPYLEDQWRNLSIGNLRFMAVKKSDRCVLTTVNQDTAEKGSEPLRTLSSYRKVDNKVYFGQNMVALDEGEVRVGDRIIPG